MEDYIYIFIEGINVCDSCYEMYLRVPQMQEKPIVMLSEMF